MKFVYNALSVLLFIVIIRLGLGIINGQPDIIVAYTFFLALFGVPWLLIRSRNTDPQPATYTPNRKPNPKNWSE